MNNNQVEYPSIGESSAYHLINGECLAEMAKLPDHSVDMVMADLPYG
jgi:DNA modification methylase